jgi:hypothetical protein
MNRCVKEVMRNFEKRRQIQKQIMAVWEFYHVPIYKATDMLMSLKESMEHMLGLETRKQRASLKLDLYGLTKAGLQ